LWPGVSTQTAKHLLHLGLGTRAPRPLEQVHGSHGLLWSLSSYHGHLGWCSRADQSDRGGLPLLRVNPLLAFSPGQHQKPSFPMRRLPRSWRISLRCAMLPPSMPPGSLSMGFPTATRTASLSRLPAFQEDRETLLAIHKVPVRHRIRVRTTNLAEDSFEARASTHQGYSTASR